MKKTCKTLAALALMLTMSLSLVACDAVSGDLGDLLGGKIDATGYMKGQLDEIYLGVFDPDYLDMVEATEAEAQETYEGGMESEVESFNYYFGVEYPTEEHNARMVELYKQVYAKADYTVVDSAKLEDGSHTVKITVRPLDIIQLMNAAFVDFSESFEAKFADVDTDAMTEEEFNDWYENTYDLGYQNGLADLFESLIPTMGYMEEKSISVQIEKDPTDGYYALNEDDFANLDLLIIDYTDNT